MTRSFDRRGGHPSASKPVSELKPPPVIIRNGHYAKGEPVSLELDCMCSKNDPNCAECWEPISAHTKDLAARLAADIAPFADQFERDVRNRFDECLELLLRKHKDYGPSNIGNAPGGPLNGLRVRMHDKLARINHLLDSGVEPSNESLRDSFADIVNYGIIGLCVLDSVWPSE